MGEDPQGIYFDGCERELEQMPEPKGALTVGIDGGYVHSRQPLGGGRAGWFEVIVGKSIPSEGSAKCFGFVHRYDRKPKRRVYETLKSQGMQMNQQIIFLSDGGERSARATKVSPSRSGVSVGLVSCTDAA